MTNKPPGYRNNATINSSNGLSSPMDFCENPVFFEISPMSIGVASCYALLIPFTLFGNGWIIVAFVTNPKLRTATNIFIAGLASSDLLVGVFSIPVWTFISAHENIAMVGYCLTLYSVYISLDIFAGCASILQLTAISIERFISVQWPMTHRKMPLLVYCFMLLFAWFCATIMAALQPLQTEAWRHIYTVVLFVACFFCPLVIVFTCYIYIFKISHFQAKPRRSSSCASGRCGTPGGTVKERKVVITVAVITGLFLIAWLPFFVVTVIATFCMPCLPAPPGIFHLVKMLKLLQYSSSAVNPYIYAYRNAEMRKAFRKITRSFIFCRRCISTTVITRNSQQSTARLQDREPHSISKNNSSFEKENVAVDIGLKPGPTRGTTLKNVKTKTAVVYLF